MAVVVEAQTTVLLPAPRAARGVSRPCFASFRRCFRSIDSESRLGIEEHRCRAPSLRGCGLDTNAVGRRHALSARECSRCGAWRLARLARPPLLRLLLLRLTCGGFGHVFEERVGRAWAGGLLGSRLSCDREGGASGEGAPCAGSDALWPLSLCWPVEGRGLGLVHRMTKRLLALIGITMKGHLPPRVSGVDRWLAPSPYPRLRVLRNTYRARSPRQPPRCNVPTSDASSHLTLHRLFQPPHFSIRIVAAATRRHRAMPGILLYC